MADYTVDLLNPDSTEVEEQRIVHPTGATAAQPVVRSQVSPVGTVTIDATVNTGGVDKQVVPVRLPQGWYLKLTLSHATVAASKYA